MLQQTQVEQVIDYFNSFISRYPTVQSLANASPDDVMKSWEGLGYYTRAQNLHKTARLIRDNFNGSMPADEKILKELPGLGKYTIHALLSIAFDQPYAASDKVELFDQLSDLLRRHLNESEYHTLFLKERE